MSQKLKVSDLVPHKDNNYFFDDIDGDAWQEFLESIKTSGIIEPIVVTQEKVIISGHQRVRACQTLGIEDIDAEVRIVDTDDEILKQLIETNIRQRGIGNPNPVKFGRCIKELERIYGVRDGSAGGTGANQYTNEVDGNNFTEADLANQLGITQRTIQNYKQLAEMIPEIQGLIETGTVTPTTAIAIVKQLPEFQQKELVDIFLKNEGKITKKDADKAIKEVKEKLEKQGEKALSKLKKEIEKKDSEIKKLEEKLASVGSQNPNENNTETHLSVREKFEKNRADRLQEDRDKIQKMYDELKESIESNKKNKVGENNTSEELTTIKQQMIINAKMELADFVRKYSDYVDVSILMKEILESI